MKYQRGEGQEGGGDQPNSTNTSEAADPAAREAAIRRAAAEFTPERRAFLEKALAEFTQDHAQRMREINAALGGEGEGEQGGNKADEQAASSASAVARKAELLDELHDIVENIDHARDLVKVGGLPTLLRLLRSPHASLRWRAADVLAASAANNPPVQRWMLGQGALPPLMALLELSAEAAAFPADSRADLLRARTKAVHALSALVRHHDGGFSALRELGGLAQLARLEGAAAAAAGAGGSDGGGGEEEEEEEDPATRQLRRRLLRKELELLRYALARAPADCAAAAALGAAERAVAGAGLAVAAAEGGEEAEDAELRAAALAVLLEMAQHPDAWRELRARLPPGLGERLARGGGGGDHDSSGPDAALARELAARLAPGAAAPAGVKQPLNDHIDLDPHDHGTHKSIPLKKEELVATAAAAAAAAAPQPARTLSLGAP
jgi:hsp70-interacting protein